MPGAASVERASPLDGYTPRDFVANRNWPTGVFRVPEGWDELKFTPERKANSLLAVRELRILSMDLAADRSASELTHAGFARRLGVSENTVNAIVSGSRFLQWHTYAGLNAVISTAQQRQQGLRPGQMVGLRRSTD